MEKRASSALTPRIALPALLVLSVLAGGCGYHLVGTGGSYLGPDLKTLYVSTFSNQTQWSDMGQRLTEAVTREWVRRRRFQLVDDKKKADLSLEGRIRSVVVSPVQFDDSGRASKYQMTLTASMAMYDVRGEKPKLLWQDKAFSRRTSYGVDPRAADYFDRQMQAMDVVSEEYARSLVSTILEGF